MSYPIAAFAVAEAGEVPAGRYYVGNDQWFLSVDANQGQPGGMSAVCLTGESTGTFIPNPQGTVTYISRAWGVEIRVKNFHETVDHQDGPLQGALMMGTFPTIYARHGHGYRLITLDGQLSNGQGIAASRRRFLAWDVWLVDLDGKREADAPLFSVQAVANDQ
ncbi:hypothetical protein ACI703_07985 [Isoptericola jiangsuensis]|uniref:hypothetical protein n=1 Tax=Isoptericola jiangsuensis TaxID=548579 RepID=UPI00386EE227